MDTRGGFAPGDLEKSLPESQSTRARGSKMLAMTPTRRKMRISILRIMVAVLLVAAAAAAGWARWVYVQIESYANQDQAAPSDAIGVFGAAEYDGRPSPVYRARLDHARTLYERGIAPLVITLGGNGGDEHSEGAVGREYLMGAGIPGSAVIAETQ